MSKRLIQIAKELNVGINTAVEFLQTKGHDVSLNPNYKITDEEEDLLNKEFLPDQEQKLASDKNSQQRREKSKHVSVSIDGYGEKNEIKTEVPQDQMPKLKVLGKIDVDAEKRQHKENKQQPTPAEKPKQTATPAPEKKRTENASRQQSAPTAETKPAAEAKPTVEAPKPQPATPKKDQVFNYGQSELKTNINVLGKIDLDALNQQTRPKKKSKEEKKKERDQRYNHNGGNNNNSNNGNNNADNEIRTNVPKLNGPKVLGTMDLSDQDSPHKRRRIQKDHVDVNNYRGGQNGQNGQNGRGGQGGQGGQGGKRRNKRNPKAEISEEDVRNQVKETLARLTSKGQSNKASSRHRHDKREMQAQQREAAEAAEAADKQKLKITEFVTVSELATMMNVPVTQVISTCMNLGLMVSINQRLDAETINIVAEEFGYETEYISAEVAEAIHEEEDKPEDLIRRPPVVTVMGHVDHGKTSLLDYIRKTNVIAGEAGGITQHIGAYNVTLSSGQQITFLDTPGHEAFTAMRARGAQVADIAIIIVAADDDVMPQTIEAINHASNAGIPIVFAINKIDKPAANPDKIKESLAQMNYLVEDWGGKYQCQEIAAKKGTGVKELMEKVLLEAELLDLKANPTRKASGIIIESQLDKGRGYTSTVLVNNGTLHISDVVVAGINQGRIKAMFNERGQRITEAKPAQPALILGLNGAPQAGDKFNVMDSEQEAREVANKREQLQREQGLRTSTHLTLDEIGRRIALGDFHEMNIIVKGDVDGSVEALSDSLIKLTTEQIQINVIHKAVGQISESDVMLAAASNAIIVGFQVRPSQSARKLAEQEKIDIRLYSIIYDAIEQIKDAMEGMLSPEIKEVVTGSAEVQKVFKISKVGTIAGCLVREGKVRRTSKVRVIREGIVVHTGELESLKREKDDVKEVTSGMECGLNVANYNDVQEGDVIEAFDEIEVARKLQ